ncbi:hypothetical protein VP01_2471g3 [Puccinia sorghi]|uniref:Uncharacterized protein n=1 Tax=Puccinia sorghi TaxID=27349 RepID=A0A0L6V609_9BASI|nr:hypothetical protein VP01_2471g3 [Puccinia sorghi]
MVLSSATRSQSVGAYRSPELAMREEAYTEAQRNLYVTATGGIKNVDKPESNNRAKGLSSAIVLKLPWKRPKGGAPKGSLFISPPASELSTVSDCTTCENQIESHNEEGYSWVCPTQEPPPRMPDTAASGSSLNVHHTSDAYPENSSTRFAKYISSPKSGAETTTIQTSISPPASPYRSSRYALKGSYHGGQAKSNDIPSPPRGKGRSGPSADHDRGAREAQVSALLPGYEMTSVPASTVAQGVRNPKATVERSKSHGPLSESTHSSLSAGFGALSPSLLSPVRSAEFRPSDLPMARETDLVLDREPFLAMMAPASHNRGSTCIAQAESNLVGAQPSPSSPTFPSSPMKYLNLLTSAGAKAASKAKGRRRPPLLEFSGPEAPPLTAPRTTPVSSSSSTDGHCCSHGNLVCCGADLHKLSPSHYSPTSSMGSSQMCESQEDSEFRGADPETHDQGDTKELSMASESSTDGTDLDDELEGVKLMVGSRAVSPKAPIQHLHYRQLQHHPRPYRQALFPPLPLSPPCPSSSPSLLSTPQLSPRQSSLPHISRWYSPIPPSTPHSPFNPDSSDIGAAF